jgi:hypothetical protein
VWACVLEILPAREIIYLKFRGTRFSHGEKVGARRFFPIDSF